MASSDAAWAYLRDRLDEPADIAFARSNASELGIDAVSTALGHLLLTLAGASKAKSIIEVGTGAGVSTLWLLRASDASHVTSIDIEPTTQQSAREAVQNARIPAARMRWITGDGNTLLGRMSDDSYDLVFVDIGGAGAALAIEHALRIARVGATIVVNGAAMRGAIANPVDRSESVGAMRELLRTLSESTAVTTSLLPIDDGVLTIVKRA